MLILAVHLCTCGSHSALTSHPAHRVEKHVLFSILILILLGGDVTAYGGDRVGDEGRGRVGDKGRGRSVTTTRNVMAPRAVTLTVDTTT